MGFSGFGVEGQVQYKTQDVVPVFWFHFTPDILVVPEQSPIKTMADFIKAAKATPDKINLGGSGLIPPITPRMNAWNAAFAVKTNYIPYKGTGDMATAVLGAQVDGAMTCPAFAINNKTRVRGLAIAMEKRHPLLPDVPHSRSWASIGSNGAYRGIGVPSPPRRTRANACPISGPHQVTNAERVDDGRERPGRQLDQVDPVMVAVERRRLGVEGDQVRSRHFLEKCAKGLRLVDESDAHSVPPLRDLLEAERDVFEGLRKGLVELRIGGFGRAAHAGVEIDLSRQLGGVSDVIGCWCHLSPTLRYHE